MEIKITWLGTASYILELEGIRLMFDPFFFRNADSYPVLNAKKEEISQIDAIFISHAHFDHCTDAGWFAQNLNVPVYCSLTAKDNMIKWSEGKIIEDYCHKLSEQAKNNIHVIEYGQKIIISEDIIVESFKSAHVKFDTKLILSRLFSYKFLKKLNTAIKYGKGFPMGKVFGYCVYFKGKKIVIMGSLWHGYVDVLQKFSNCEVFIAPIAGNSNRKLVKKASQVIKILKPKIVIPVHWDDFFPPISNLIDLKPFYEEIKKNYPDTKVITPVMDAELMIPIS